MELAVIEKEALLLPETDRAVLADRLLASLSGDSEKIRSGWIAEADSRFEAYLKGDLPPVDGREAMDELRSKFGR